MKSAARKSRAFLFMNSPISHLTEILQKVKESAQIFDSQLKVSESATRAALIDPVLRALGWDIANPGRVLVEKTQTVEKKQLRVDYALLRQTEIKIVVEAKKLGGNLKEEFLQLVNYSFGLNVGSLFVTDGLLWHHYQHLSSNNQNPVREFNLSLDNLPEVAAYFVQHMDAALISPETPKIDELSQRVDELERFIAQFKSKLSQSEVTPQVSKPIGSKITQKPKVKPPTAKETLKSGENWYALDNSQKHYNEKAIVITVGALRDLAKVSDQILPEIAKAMEAQLAKRQVKVIKRRWIAQTQEELYDNPKLWKSSVEIVPGWWLGTNYSNSDKRDMLTLAAQVAKNFGVQLEFHLT